MISVHDENLGVEERLSVWFEDIGSVVVALSGGVDSSVLAVLASRVLGDRALAVTAVSSSLAQEELLGVRGLVVEHGLSYREVLTQEGSDPVYVANGPNRCYVCKSHLFREMAPLAASRKAVMVVGTNLDDLNDIRPGMLAATEAGVRSPYLECHVSKVDIRMLASQLGLRDVAQKPASACLASRIPTGTRVTVRRLSMVEQFEQFLHRLGFAEVRVRHHESIARIEVPERDFARIVGVGGDLVREAKRIGFSYCSLDLLGLHWGRERQEYRGREYGSIQGETLVRG
ncbi:MAG: ATP-dependent sacrificial sulfur transferase LarE [Ferrimicrobium sp.]